MTYLTLDEAADWLTHRLGGEASLGSRVLPSQVFAFGLANHIRLCVALDKECYSPSTRVRSEATMSRDELLATIRADMSGASAATAATVEVYGYFVVPPRHLFALERAETVTLEVVFSLDSQDIFYPYEVISRNRLRINNTELQQFADSLVVTPVGKTSIASASTIKNKLERYDNLARAMMTCIDTLQNSGFEPTSAAVITELKKLEGDGYIHSVKSDAIMWFAEGESTPKETPIKDVRARRKRYLTA